MMRRKSSSDSKKIEGFSKDKPILTEKSQNISNNTEHSIDDMIINECKTSGDLKDKRMKIWGYIFILSIIWVLNILSSEYTFLDNNLLLSILRLLFLQITCHINQEELKYYPRIQNLYIGLSSLVLNLVFYIKNPDTTSFSGIATYHILLVIIVFMKTNSRIEV